MEENIPPQAEAPSNSVWQKVDPRANMKGILILLGVIVVLGGLFTFNSVRNSSKKQAEEQKQTSQAKFLANNTLVYGYWTDSSSVIEAVDLSTNKNNILAILPGNIKNVKILSPNEISFLKDTDERDYAKSLVLYDISSEQEKVVATTDEDFGIDDYFISKNGQYVTIWELSLPSSSPQLTGSRSRIYSIDVRRPGQKNLIYDEVANPGDTIHYPIAITNNGNIYTNKFIPNAGMGWSYGMGVSNFAGTNKEDIASMQNGTYANQPAISADESKFVFVGYDGARGDGSQIVDGTKRVFSVANTIETLDTATKTRTKLATAQGEDVFSSSALDLTTGDVIYQLINAKSKTLDTYAYSFSQNASRKIDFDISFNNSSTNAINTVKTSLSNGRLLIASVATSQSTMGNLGSRYEQSLSTAYVLDQQTGERTEVNHNGAFMQFIGLTGDNYFDPKNLSESTKNQQGKQLQLETFTIKPTLAPIRIARNNRPQTNDTPQLDCTQTAAAQACGTLNDGAEQASCVNNATNQCAGTCPLYLYGENGKELSVSVGTPIFSPNAFYDPERGVFDITLLSKGEFRANGDEVSSLTFKYAPAIKKLQRPEYGAVVKREEIKRTLSDFASELGLNDKETSDLLDYATSNMSLPFVYLSFYSHDLSNQILPMQFSTQPDTYRNIVFYFEQFESRPNLSPKPPVFEPIIRSGFTAIEISYIIK